MDEELMARIDRVATDGNSATVSDVNALLAALESPTTRLQLIRRLRLHGILSQVLAERQQAPAGPIASASEPDRSARSSVRRRLPGLQYALAACVLLAAGALLFHGRSGERSELGTAPEGSEAKPTCSDTRLTVNARPRDSRKDVLSSSGLSIRRGDRLTITATGRWSVGLGHVDANGREGLCECLVRDAQNRGALGALIGRIGTGGTPFSIGATSTFSAEAEGMLYLGANDNMGPCKAERRGSCYDDNLGALTVRLEHCPAP